MKSSNDQKPLAQDVQRLPRQESTLSLKTRKKEKNGHTALVVANEHATEKLFPRFFFSSCPLFMGHGNGKFWGARDP